MAWLAANLFQCDCVCFGEFALLGFVLGRLSGLRLEMIYYIKLDLLKFAVVLCFASIVFRSLVSHDFVCDLHCVVFVVLVCLVWLWLAELSLHLAWLLQVQPGLFGNAKISDDLRGLALLLLALWSGWLGPMRNQMVWR